MANIVEAGGDTVVEGSAVEPSMSVLVASGIDPARAVAWGACPFCGATLVLGHSPDGNPRLLHAMLLDAETKQPVAGCEPYREVALGRLDLPGFMKLCRSKGGVTWRPWTRA